MTSFDSNGSFISPTLVPNTRDCLFDGIGGEGASYSSRGEEDVDDRDSGFAEEARRPKPNRLPVFGGRGGGCESSEERLVYPESCRLGGFGFPSSRILYSYFCRINLSIAESTSSTSMGIGGFTPLGLYNLFTALFPLRFIFFGVGIYHQQSCTHSRCDSETDSHRPDPMTSYPYSKI